MEVRERHARTEVGRRELLESSGPPPSPIPTVGRRSLRHRSMTSHPWVGLEHREETEAERAGGAGDGYDQVGLHGGGHPSDRTVCLGNLRAKATPT